MKKALGESLASKESLQVLPSSSSSSAQVSTTVPQRNQPATKRKPTGAAKRKSSGQARGDAGELREIARMQKDNTTSRLVLEMLKQQSKPDLRITPLALMALIESTDAYKTVLLTDARTIAVRRGQENIQARDIQLFMSMCGPKKQ